MNLESDSAKLDQTLGVGRNRPVRDFVEIQTPTDKPQTLRDTRHSADRREGLRHANQQIQGDVSGRIAGDGQRRRPDGGGDVPLVGSSVASRAEKRAAAPCQAGAGAKAAYCVDLAEARRQTWSP